MPAAPLTLRKTHHSGSGSSIGAGKLALSPDEVPIAPALAPHSSASSELRASACAADAGAAPETSATSASSCPASLPVALATAIATGAEAEGLPSLGGSGSSSSAAPRSSAREHGSKLLSDLQILNEIPPELLGTVFQPLFILVLVDQNLSKYFSD